VPFCRLAGGRPAPADVELGVACVHADHRVAGGLVIRDPPADVAELRVPVRVLGALDSLGVACRLNPFSRSRSPTVSAEALCPWAVSSAASVRVDFAVHRSGDIGSPAPSAPPAPAAQGAARHPPLPAACGPRSPPGPA
jgi:hypothetical protein